MTTAEKIAEMFANDGQVFELADGRNLDTVCADLEGSRHARDGGTCWSFDDGSVIVAGTHAWDLGIPGSGDTCYCWRISGHFPTCGEAPLPAAIKEMIRVIVDLGYDDAKITARGTDSEHIEIDLHGGVLAKVYRDTSDPSWQGWAWRLYDAADGEESGAFDRVDEIVPVLSTLAGQMETV